MFEPFRGRYVWNLSTNLALATGGLIGEIDASCSHLYEADFDTEDDATQAFFTALCGLADRLVAQAQADGAAGRVLSAGHKHHRAAVYYQTAERMQNHSYEPRREAYRKTLESFAYYLEYTDQPAERVTIPYGESELSGILMHGDAPGPTPCVVFFNGLDSTKEQFYGTGTAQNLRSRGIATLMIDPPGSGEALRLKGLVATPDTEKWAAACIDYLAGCHDVDEEMIGLIGWSLGGYYAPRAVAFEPRLKFGVAWGSNYDWGQVQLDRLANLGDRPVPHYWEHVQWVWGAENLGDFMKIAPAVTLRGILDRITVPFLVVHGEHDRQIPLRYAHDLYADLVNSPKKDLTIFTDDTGGVEHCSVDNMPVVVDYICDWIGETVGELRGTNRLAATRSTDSRA